MSDRINKKMFWFLGENTPEKNKIGNVQLYMSEMALRSLQIFEYTGLPETIPKWALESILMTTGRNCDGCPRCLYVFYLLYLQRKPERHSNSARDVSGTFKQRTGQAR